MTPTAVPRANSAEMIGRIAAKNDPKMTPSTMKARTTPGRVPPKDCLLDNSASWPVTATWRWPPAGAVAVSTNLFASGWVRFWNC